jgi:hypothetical protein
MSASLSRGPYTGAPLDGTPKYTKQESVGGKPKGRSLGKRPLLLGAIKLSYIVWTVNP